MSDRRIQRIIPSMATSDGAGVKLRRSLGSRDDLRLDPFLMLDEFYSDNPDDYLAGFPNHPHRGFETVTYMLDGHMQHQDSGGNTGDLGPGDVQWMTAARGLIHSEMPQQTEGRMRGFQLWLNLPAKDKMQPPAYRDIPAHEIPSANAGPGATVKVIAGEVEAAGVRVAGPAVAGATDARYIDVHLDAGASWETTLPEAHNAFLYVYEGSAHIGTGAEEVPHRAAAVLTQGERLKLVAGAQGARLLLLAGRPIGEPVVQYGPFVMNTRAEIEQAIADYRSGELARYPVKRLNAG